MGLKYLVFPLIIGLGLSACSSKDNLVSKLSNGDAAINYGKITSTNYMTSRGVQETGAGKSESDVSLSNELRAAWFFPENKQIGIGSYIIDFSNPKFNPNNNMPEGFVVPVKNGDKTVYYTFIDKDLFDMSTNQSIKQEFESLGNEVYLKISKPMAFQAVYGETFKDGYSFYVYDLESFWR